MYARQIRPKGVFSNVSACANNFNMTLPIPEYTLTLKKGKNMRNLIISATALISLWLPIVDAAQSGGLSILVIGDSNTENGYITYGLSDTLQRYFGVLGMGKGYVPMDSSFYEVRNKFDTGITIGYNPSQWTKMDMFEGTRLPASDIPYLSPNGQWLKSSTLNAITTVTFPGTGVDLYWLADTTGGSFSTSIDGKVLDTISTTGNRLVQKTTITGLASGSHSMQLKVLTVPTGGLVTLLGFDAHTDIPGRPKRSEVHNWGNGYCASIDFVNIDSTIFVTGLQQLHPDVVVVLLGTNDYVQDKRTASAFKANLIVILNRIKASGINASIMLTSTFMTGDTLAPVYLPKYQDSAWPQAAETTGVQYWDMCTWFGPYVAADMIDVYHCNQANGKKIGVEMFDQILSRFPLTSVVGQPAVRAAAPSSGIPGVQYLSGEKTLKLSAQVSCEINLTSIAGRQVARVVSAEPGQYRVGRGVLSAPPGVYLLRVASAGRCSEWTVPLIK
jgi:hypothetical protein